MNEAIVFRQLGHAYQPGRWIMREYSGAIPAQSIFTILGPNGRGKTTLLQLFLGLLKPIQGTIRANGRMALVPQLFQTTFDFTALDMVLMGRARKVGLFSQPSKQDVQAALTALDRFRLADFADQSFFQLSGGQRQLVILARALVAEAEILVLDEPTSALDLKNQALVLEWIVRLSREDGLTVLFSTHHPHHALAVADNALLMFGEQDYVCGPVVKVLTEENLQYLYGVPLKHLRFTYQGQEVETLAPVFQPR